LWYEAVCSNPPLADAVIAAFDSIATVDEPDEEKFADTFGARRVAYQEAGSSAARSGDLRTSPEDPFLRCTLLGRTAHRKA